MTSALGRRAGLSLIELLASIGILSILIGLMLVAVQATRETSRKSYCTSNLRQIGLALQLYEAQFKCFPREGGWSFLYRILPYIQNQAFDSLTDPFKAYPVPLFRCPSDLVVDLVVLEGQPQPGTNFVGNCGTWHLERGFDGVFGYESEVRAADITDGLTNTGMVSELLRANMTENRYRVNWETPRSFGRGEIDVFDQVCRSLPQQPAAFGWRGDIFARGTPWAKGNVGFSLYNHVSPPGNPSCYNRGAITDGAITPVSLHGEIVNVCFADGHIDSVSYHINRAVWRRMGSRAGGEQ